LAWMLGFVEDWITFTASRISKETLGDLRA
jgi:hypothetical protein